MKFDNHSVLLNDGINIKIKLNIPEIFGKFVISDKIWSSAIKTFNQRLHERLSVTETINGKFIDILQLEPIGDPVLNVIIYKNDSEIIENTWFSITGQLIFNDFSPSQIDSILISDLIYKDLHGEVNRILNKS